MSAMAAGISVFLNSLFLLAVRFFHCLNERTIENSPASVNENNSVGARFSPTITTIKVLEHEWQAIRDHLLADDGEKIVFGIGYRCGGVVFVKDWIVPADSDYVSRCTGRLELKAAFLNRGVFKVFVQSDGDILINLHSHPFGHGRVAFSNVDDNDDLVLLRHMRDRLAIGKKINNRSTEIHTISMVLDHESVDARLLDAETEKFIPIPRILIIGAKVNLIHTTSCQEQPAISHAVSEMYSKQIEVFGAEAQAKMAHLHVVVCGVGGLGSIVCEAVLRLGFRNITLIDADKLESSNLNRWHGGCASDINRNKVDIASELLCRQFPDANIAAISTDIYAPEAVSAIVKADILIGGVDNTAARAFLSRLASQYVIPYFDGAAQVCSTELSTASPLYRVAVMVPGHTACFDCSKVRPYDRQIAQDEFFSPRAVKFARAQGYLKEAPEDQSVAVYGLNLQCIGALITELQNYVAPYRNPAFFISNEAEYSTRYVASDTRNAIHDGLIAGLRFPMTHAATQADEDCPHCGSWRLGRMESLDIAYPHVAKESVEAALPDPLAYLE